MKWLKNLPVGLIGLLHMSSAQAADLDCAACGLVSGLNFSSLASVSGPIQDAMESVSRLNAGPNVAPLIYPHVGAYPRSPVAVPNYWGNMAGPLDLKRLLNSRNYWDGISGDLPNGFQMRLTGGPGTWEWQTSYGFDPGFYVDTRGLLPEFEISPAKKRPLPRGLHEI